MYVYDKFVHASRERNGDFDVCACMCVLYMADDVVAVLICFADL